MKRTIVSFGGGTGQPVLLRGLRKIGRINIIAVATTVDSGGSTRRFRDEWGMLPPSDVFRCILGLSSYSDKRETREFLLWRIKGICPELDGHTIANSLLTILTRQSSYLKAVQAISYWLKSKGTVLPITLDDVHLVGITRSGRIYPDEASIGTRNDCEPFEKLFLSPRAEPLPQVLEALKRADVIIFGPGDLITSQLPHLLVKEVASSIVKAKGVKIQVINITTRYAETHRFAVSDHVLFLEKYLGGKVDYVVCNNRLIPPQTIRKYKKEKAYPVELDVGEDWEGRKVLCADLLKEGDFARHDPDKLARVVSSIVLSQ